MYLRITGYFALAFLIYLVAWLFPALMNFLGLIGIGFILFLVVNLELLKEGKLEGVAEE